MDTETLLAIPGIPLLLGIFFTLLMMASGNVRAGETLFKVTMVIGGIYILTAITLHIYTWRNRNGKKDRNRMDR